MVDIECLKCHIIITSVPAQPDRKILIGCNNVECKLYRKKLKRKITDGKLID